MVRGWHEAALCRTNGAQLYWQASDGSGAPELIAEDARAPESWSAPLGLVIHITLTGAADYDIWAYSPADRTRKAILAEPTSAQMSSRHEIYVEPFPRTGTRIRVSDAGGERPVWSPDGRELYYDKDATLFVAAITIAPLSTWRRTDRVLLRAATSRANLSARRCKAALPSSEDEVRSQSL